MPIKHCIWNAVALAQAIKDIKGTNGEIHRERSRNFVESLAEQLWQHEGKPRNAVSMAKHRKGNRERFGMNELLFDITVAKYQTVHSGSSGKNLSYITKGIWIVESEMATNKREALYDFNKLVLGNSEKKLFVGPQVRDEVEYLRVLKAAAQNCEGELYVSLIPHPRIWPVDSEKRVRLWTWDTAQWKLIA